MMNITLTATRSELIAQELLESLKGSAILFGDGRQYNYLVITNEDKENPFYSEEEIQKMSLEEMTEIINDVNQSYYSYSDKKSAADDIRNISIEEQFKAEYQNTLWHDLKHDFIAFGYCPFGYCLGDVIKVYHYKVADEHKLNSDAVGNIFFDQPLTINITKDGELLNVLDEITYSFNIKDFEKKLRDNNELNLTEEEIQYIIELAEDDEVLQLYQL